MTLFDDLGLPDHPLLNDPPYHNNRCSRIKRIWIIIGSLSFTILIIAFAASMLLMHIRRQQEKPLSINKFSTSTKSTTLNKFTTRTTNLKISVTNKQQLWSVTTNASMTTTNTSMTTTNTSVTTTSTFLASDALKTITSKNCFSSGWNPIGEPLIQAGRVYTFAVDDDFNIYTANYDLEALQKWLPGAKKPINLFEGRFQYSPIFYHSLTRSLYFFYTFNDKPGVYKISVIDTNPKPENVFSASGKGSGLNQLALECNGLYVTAAGDIFILDKNNYRIVKWSPNATSGVLVAGGNGKGSGSDQFSISVHFFVDEINNALYVIDSSNYRVLKYTDGSPHGVTILGGGPSTVFSKVMSEYVNAISILVDKMGNILVGEMAKITKWTPDIKSRIVVATGKVYEDSKSPVAMLSIPALMTFDKLENLYVYDTAYQQVFKYYKNSTACVNIIS